VQTYEKEIGADPGFISDNTVRLKRLTVDVNLALDDFLNLAFKADGRWQFDDSNHTDYPIITTNIVANQRDYNFTSDEGGNLILEVLKVDTGTFYDGQNGTGTPVRYDKLANGIFLDPIPSYNYTNGLKIYINREASYFVYTDTTKKPGIPGIFHRYLALKPALDFARRNISGNYQALQAEILRMEADIKTYFSLRGKDQRNRMTVTSNNK